MMKIKNDKVKSKNMVMDKRLPEIFAALSRKNLFLEPCHSPVRFFTFYFLLFNFFSPGGVRP